LVSSAKFSLSFRFPKTLTVFRDDKNGCSIFGVGFDPARAATTENVDLTLQRPRSWFAKVAQFFNRFKLGRIPNFSGTLNTVACVENSSTGHFLPFFADRSAEFIRFPQGHSKTSLW
jgi:hypothetical protein